MTDLPHVALYDVYTEEIASTVKAYLREHGREVNGTRVTVDLCSKAIDWWNGLRPEEREGTAT